MVTTLPITENHIWKVRGNYVDNEKNGDFWPYVYIYIYTCICSDWGLVPSMA